MTHTYNISGMTCDGCVAKAKSELLKIGDVTDAEVQLNAPQATINMQKHIPIEVLQTALNKAGNFTIRPAEDLHPAMNKEETKSWLATYKPVLLIAAYITGLTLLIEAASGSFHTERWMSNFMAAFFLVFSFFKLLDLKGFAESYSTYDIIAKRWNAWGYVYAFIELGLGVAYLLNFHPLLTNTITFLIMGISIIGVMQSIFSKRKIRCACLGVVFNLPMSTITILEDGLMIAMSLLMLLSLMNASTPLI